MIPTASTAIPFEAALEVAIKQKVRELRADGCTAMSLANLRQVVPTPPATLSGAPRGTNAIWSYSEIFESVATANPSISKFLIR